MQKITPIDAKGWAFFNSLYLPQFWSWTAEIFWALGVLEAHPNTGARGRDHKNKNSPFSTRGAHFKQLQTSGF